jgi:uncharacterized protein YbjT (DUF2867 family)
MMAKIILAGATGLVGNALANILCRSGHELHIIGRRHIDGMTGNVHQHIAPTPEWPALTAGIKADVAISCLGTTMKQAGSKAAFAAVDLDLVLAFAQAAKQGGARQMMAVSSTMALPDSNNFYLKTKGQAEQGINDLKFDRIDFMRPGLLRGDRNGPTRPGEMVGALISPLTDMLLMGSLRKYRSISADSVARAMANLVSAQERGRFIHENDAILSLAS